MVNIPTVLIITACDKFMVKPRPNCWDLLSHGLRWAIRISAENKTLLEKKQKSEPLEITLW